MAPVIWDRDCLARCTRSPAILATEPLTEWHQISISGVVATSQLSEWFTSEHAW
jgi:hypothetical protein